MSDEIKAIIVIAGALSFVSTTIASNLHDQTRSLKEVRNEIQELNATIASRIDCIRDIGKDKDEGGCDVRVK